MKKSMKILSLALALTLCLGILTGCSELNTSSSTAATGDGSTGAVEAYDVDYTAYLDENGYLLNTTAGDYVTLPNYKGLEIPADVSTASDTDVQAQIDSMLASYTVAQEITGRAAQSGDTANIAYAGSVDGVLFEGGTSDAYDLVLGSGSFIDGFEDQIIGHNVGDSFDVIVTFPDGYSDSTDADGNAVVLANKEAVFAVTLNSLSESVVPELTDEFVTTNLKEQYGYETADDLREDIADNIVVNQEDEYVLNWLMENSTVSEVPEIATNFQQELCLEYYATYATYYGMNVDDFLSANGYEAREDLYAENEETFKTEATKNLIAQAICEQEGLTATDEDVVSMLGIDSIDTYTANYGEDYVRYMKWCCVLLLSEDYIKDNAAR